MQEELKDNKPTETGHTQENMFNDTKTPHVSKVVFGIQKRDEFPSKGRVTRTINLNVDGPLHIDNTYGTCFCPNIFGRDRSSVIDGDDKNYKESLEMRKRASNVGHIQLPVPVTHPGAIQKKYLQKLFSLTDVNTFVEVAEWSAYVVRPFFKDDKSLEIFELHRFIELNKEVLNSKDIKIITLNNSNTYAPKLVVTEVNGEYNFRLVDTTKLTTLQVFDTSNNLLPLDSQGNLVSDKKKVIARVALGEYPPEEVVEVEIELDSLKREVFRVGKNPEEILKEKIIVFKDSLFSAVRTVSRDNSWLTDITSNFQMLTGSYAILDLLSDIDVDKEIRYLSAQLKHIKEKRNASIQPDSYSSVYEIPTKELSEIKNYNEQIKAISLQFNMMVSLKKQNCSPTELVMDYVPVIPLEFRNRVPIKTGKATSYRSDKINDFYNEVLEDTKELERWTLPTYEELISYKKVQDSVERLDLRDHVDNMRDPTLVGLMKKVEENIFENVIASTSKNDKDFKSLMRRIGSKTGRARSDAQGKRTDESARGVITPDKNLELDELGVPYDILKVHFREDIISRVMDKYPDTRSLGKQKLAMAIHTLGNRVENMAHSPERTHVPYLLEPKFLSKTNESNMTIDDLILTELQEIVKEPRYLAIRFPSLHHLNGLGYRIKIVYSKTIHLNPLVCAGYNADFDGDQMSIFLLRLKESIREVDEIISPIKNDMGADGRPLMTPTQDMIMGLYLLTLQPDDYDTQPVKGRYSSFNKMMSAYDMGRVDLEDKVQVLMPDYTNSIFSQKFKRYKIAKKVEREEYQVEDDNRNPEYINISYQGEDFLDINKGLREITTLDRNEIIYTPKETTNPASKGMRVPDQLIFSQLQPTANIPTKVVESTVGRFIFNSLIPQDLGLVDRTKDPFGLEWNKGTAGITGRELSNLITKIFSKYSTEVSSYVRDLFKDSGYHFVTLSGISLSLEDIKTSTVRDEIVEETYDKIELLKLEQRDTPEERIRLWEEATQKIKDLAMEELDDRNPVKMMAVSGARGKDTQIAQMIGIRGIMMDANNNKIAVPILENFSEGLSPISYIISSYGSCKGIIDRSNKTAETGDLARHLIFGNSSVILTEGDCGDTTGFRISYYPKTATKEYSPQDLLNKETREVIYDANNKIVFEQGQFLDSYCEETVAKVNSLPKDKKYKATDIVPLSRNVIGRTPVKDILDRDTGKVLFYANIPIPAHSDNLEILDKQYTGKGINVRSIQTCKSGTIGYCTRCYGYLFPKHRHSNVGDSVGTFAAHSLSEPGTQMTMRTFHTGGVADGDTSAGFEDFKTTILFASNMDKHEEAFRASINFDNEFEKTKDKMAELRKLLANRDMGTLEKTLNKLVFPSDFTYQHFGLANLHIHDKLFYDFYKGIRDPMISNDLDNILSINFEITARQATSNVTVVDPGDSIHAVGTTIKIKDLIQTNLILLYQRMDGIVAVPTINGFKSVIPDISDPTKSLIFQNVVERATELAMLGAEDDLTNPMTALTVGNIMPLGENIRYYKDKIKINPDKVTTVYDLGLAERESKGREETVEDFTEVSKTEEKRKVVTPPVSNPNQMKTEDLLSSLGITETPPTEPKTPVEPVSPPKPFEEEEEPKDLDNNTGTIIGFK